MAVVLVALGLVSLSTARRSPELVEADLDAIEAGAPSLGWADGPPRHAPRGARAADPRAGARSGRPRVIGEGVAEHGPVRGGARSCWRPPPFGVPADGQHHRRGARPRRPAHPAGARRGRTRAPPRAAHRHPDGGGRHGRRASARPPTRCTPASASRTCCSAPGSACSPACGSPRSPSRSPRPSSSRTCCSPSSSRSDPRRMRPSGWLSTTSAREGRLVVLLYALGGAGGEAVAGGDVVRHERRPLVDRLHPWRSGVRPRSTCTATSTSRSTTTRRSAA